MLIIYFLLIRVCSDRYRPLPTVHTLPFLLSLHLPLLSSYAQRITSALDAFESLSFGLILPGALAEGRAATAGIGGIVRLARSVASARWMSEKCAEYGEDAVSALRSFRFDRQKSKLILYLSLS